MGYTLSAEVVDRLFARLSEEFTLYAPTRFAGGGRFSDTDLIRYREVHSVEEIEFDEKSDHTFKEALVPITQTLFYFTEEQVKEADPPPKGVIIFLRSCDLHAVKCLDEIYLRNGVEDYYYKRVRETIRFVLIGCPAPFENCFCVDMGTNRSNDYDLYLQPKDGGYLADNRYEPWETLLADVATAALEVEPAFVSETPVRVHIPQNLTAEVAASPLWDEYDSRCIACGRCNFSCPTCTCYTMQDLFYTDNGKVGERRRVWASCMVDGFTDVAGGGCYRQKNGQRMRFKVLHKALDYKQRFGRQMCVGCGRCDDVCPEYISFSGAVNKLEDGMEEVAVNAAK